MCTILGYKGRQLSYQQIEKGLQTTTSRGPDDQRILQFEDVTLGFQRLSIMGLTPEGMQPFTRNGSALVCNGEIYGFRKIKDHLIQNGIEFTSESDCEILLPLYEEKGCDMFKELDAEFALVLYDAKSNQLIAARDPIGIRPLYYGYDKNGDIIFASEPKMLVKMVDSIYPFPVGHYYKDKQFICYRDMTQTKEIVDDDLETICQNIHDYLIKGVNKRLDADAPVGFLLSGGLDSSLV
ncbi:MAG: asparagine synthase-related protein, partial [Floccifex sp.]